MIFDISPSQIESLDSKQLVELLYKLLHAEAQRYGTGLRGVSVPPQITIADGGEDARISWVGGIEQTDYLPSRLCIFQAKATNLGPAGWKKEVWTKPTQKKDAKWRELNKAVKNAINENASYIGFTTAVLIGDKYNERIKGIKQGIQEAGGDLNQLKAIDIYDANKITDWVSQHPAIALWLNERQSGLNLRSFETIETLGKKTDISSIPPVEDTANRFLLENKREDSLTFEKIKERITDYLADSKKSIRVLGSSGVGKTRFVYEVFRDETSTAKTALATSAIYCDFRDIGNQIFPIAQSCSEAGKSALMIVDECPRKTAIKLSEIITTESSNLRILTIGNDNQPIEKDNCLNIFVEPADDTLIEGIIQQRYPKADYLDINFIKKLSAGYPRIAVLATDNYSEGLPILKSVEDVVERILVGCGINRPEQVRAIECLSLFNRLGADENVSDEIDFVAEHLARQTGDEMYEHLAYAAKQDLVDYRYCYFIAQPLPIAAFLGARRLDLLRVKTILNFIENASPELRESFLSQWRYFDASLTAAKVAERLLAKNGWCSSLEGLKKIGLQCLKAIVHIDPDGVTDVIEYVYKDLSIDELEEAVTIKQDFVQVLSILVSRKRSFHRAAPLLMRLAAINNDEIYVNSANRRFKQLFQLHLSQTEANPSERFAILDQGLSSGDERVISLCIKALEKVLKWNRSSASGISNQIGNQPPLKEWTPKTWDEVFDFLRNGLQRLTNIRAESKQFAEQCEKILASHIRSLLGENLFGDIENIVKDISQEKGIWLEAIKGVGDWLYFDRKKAPEDFAKEDFAKKVRDFYDSLIPTDPIQQALLYTKFWSSHLRNPDLNHERDDRSREDFEYSSRKAKEIAAVIAGDQELTYRAIQTMVREELNNVSPFTYELAMRLENPIEAFQFAVKEFEASTNRKGVQFLRGLISGIDKKNPESATQCIQIASKSEALKDQMGNIYRAVHISVERLNEIVQGIKQGSIPVTECAYFSYGKGLDHFSAEEILPLIDELAFNHGAEGMWISLEIISFYQYDRDNLDKRIAERIKQITTSNKLFETLKSIPTDANSFEQVILLIQNYYSFNDEFASELSQQIIKLCQIKYNNIFLELDSNLANIFKLLVKENPKVLWKNLSHFFEIATPLEIYCLKNIIGTLRYPLDGESYNQESLFFDILDAECREWAKVNPEIRSPFLCLFYPILNTNTTGDSAWHPALENLTYEFGAVREFREAIQEQFFPSFYEDSIIPYLEKYLIPLETWFDHQVPEMSTWARNIYRSLERRIDRERKRQ
ncbi:hypothetical protein PCC7424_3851 [Gloeothece citriformis PCC 7424]|uniref:Uncharacterized protein n=1 Tax=Gloeothece citriformis (strain PCC 7424) TaxID=65393 RepID=B7KJE7_GLOC7|nr:hypothetical protein [Gloeothece citriformis]ACK72231.1 hypothetical protein PCC7424_3851 [Gloeothece citriformis PCC 7424]